jgi:hypothetical protein
MRRYLVVANQTLAGEHLSEKVRECLAAGPASFHIVVPATPPEEHVTWIEGQAHAIAQERLDAAIARLRELGADAQGEVGDANPILAIEDTLRRQEFEEIIVSTLPAGMSRWLGLDLPSRVQRTFDLPVSHIVEDRQPAAE